LLQLFILFAQKLVATVTSPDVILDIYPLGMHSDEAGAHRLAEYADIRYASRGVPPKYLCQTLRVTGKSMRVVL
jgi:hypothetical protein